MNVIRRILEHYFLQLCGYDGSQLRKIILEDNKHCFQHDDYTQFNIAMSMLSYISSSTHGVNDGFYYIDDCTDIEQCKKVFQKIFYYMGQEQHYNMMMGVSGRISQSLHI